jgi:hypothetical protein
MSAAHFLSGFKATRLVSFRPGQWAAIKEAGSRADLTSNRIFIAGGLGKLCMGTGQQLGNLYEACTTTTFSHQKTAKLEIAAGHTPLMAARIPTVAADWAPTYVGETVLLSHPERARDPLPQTVVGWR